MLRTGLLLLALTSLAIAQGQPTTTTAPQSGIPDTPRYATFAQASYDDVYCGGFIAPTIAQSEYVVGGWNTPDTTRFSTDEYIYLHGTYQEGADYTILRRLKDPNRYEVFKGQHAAINSAGSMYAEMGRAHIRSVRGDVAIAHLDFTCDTVVPGDIVVPFKAKEIPSAHGPIAFDQFALPNNKLSGRIIGARDFDYVAGLLHKVYLNVGADKGVKVGDYFRVTRTYQATKEDDTDTLSFKATVAEDTQMSPPVLNNLDVSHHPRRAVGELQITDVEAHSATGMVAFSFEQMFAGDVVELDELPPAISNVAAMNPPRIACTARPAALRAGDVAQISCDISSPDDRPLSVTFQSSGGQINAQGNNATLVTSGAAPGPIEVLATATDDRNLSSSSQVSVNVEGPPAATAPNMANTLGFKPGSAYVDNRAKAMLDDLAMHMQSESDSTVALVGSQDPTEPQGTADKRALNAKAYLTSKGIDPKRVDTRATTNPGAKVDIWTIPAGAPLPPDVSSATPVTGTPTTTHKPRHKAPAKKTP